VAPLFLVLLAQVRRHEEISALAAGYRALLSPERNDSRRCWCGAGYDVVVASHLPQALFEGHLGLRDGGEGLSLEPQLRLRHEEISPNFGKILLALVMFAGRVGPITLVVALGEQTNYRYVSGRR